MNSYYFYTIVLGFALGVGVASLFTIGFAYVVWVVMLAGVVWVMSRRNSFAVSSGHLALLSLFLITIALGMIRFNIEAFDEVNPLYEAQTGQEVLLQGVVVREPDIREKTTHLYVRVDDELFLVIVGRYTEVSYDDELEVKGKLTHPDSFETDLGRVFNYPKYLQARGVTYMVSFAQIQVLEKNKGNIFIQKIFALKKEFMQKIEAVIPEPQVGLAEGLLLGVKQALGDELETVFRKTGIIHIVVLSGYNVTLVVLFITYILAYLLPYRARIPFGLAAIVCFAILVGLSATVVRASIMASLILFARASGRTYAVIRALMIAGLIMVLINPYLLVYDVGFQLSFLATLGLLLVAPYIEKILVFVPNFIQIREFITATISTQIFVMPILLYSIGEFSAVSVIVNVLVLPMVPVAMLLTFLTGIVGFVSVGLSVLLGYITYISLSYILVIATFFAEMPFASFVVPVFPFWVVVLSYGVLLYLIYRLNGLKKDVEIEVLDFEIEAEDKVFGWTIEEEDVVKARLK